MPIYEYRCDQCSQEFEKLVRRPDQEIHCPGCESVKVQRKLSLIAAPISATGSSECPPSDAPPCSPGCCRLP